MKKNINLITLRQNQKLTQKDIATKLNISLKQYQRLEAGTSDGSIEVWRKLKEIFNKPIDFLLEQEIEETQENDNTEKDN